jgi:probable F420-dependent oxidoreductase
VFEVYASTPESMSPATIGDHARRAEDLGYDGLLVPDAVHDGLLLAAGALSATTKLRVGTSVLVAFPRSPMNVAIASWDLASMSGGRFELGLGTQIRRNIEERYSTAWTSPVTRMREYLGSLRAIFASFQHGARLDFRGEHYQFTRLQPFFNPGPIEHPEIPIFLGAVKPHMTRLAGESADGLITHPTNTPPRYLHEECVPKLREGAKKSGRTLDSFRLILGALVATGRDQQQVDAAIEQQRGLLGFLYSTPAYWPSLKLFGWQDRGEQLRELTRKGDWQAMRAIVDENMLAEFVPAGTYDEIPARLKQRYAGLSAQITFPLPEDPQDDAAAARAICELQSP